MNKKTLKGTLVVAAVLGLGWALYAGWSGNGGPEEPGIYDSFAQCLSQRGATMYGAYWCSHCKNEKAAFGESFRFVNYVECTQDPNRCAAAGVQGYPTWTFPDGRKLEGEQGIKGLAAASGCTLPTSTQP